MFTHRIWLACALATLGLLPPTLAPANDVDGPNDCQRVTRDRGDAPEGILAYPGVVGRFPTCLSGTAPGAQTFDCPPISTIQGPTDLNGYILNVNSQPGLGYWLGCGPATGGPMGIDSDSDGKVSDGGPMSACDQGPVDCIQAAFGLSFGQDECFGDDDAGLVAAPSFTPCGTGSVTFKTYNCGPGRQVFLNVLVDWNQDGDWNDNLSCPGAGGVCAFEWAVKNAPIDIVSGCGVRTSPSFRVGPQGGPSWMRITISDQPVPDDYPWNGSAGTPAGFFAGGETEDYPITIDNPPNPCQVGYYDLGDAPEGIAAFPSGAPGHYPTCQTPSAPGTMEIECGTANGSLPGPTGYVKHQSFLYDSTHFWLGCVATSPLAASIDDEPDGKVNVGLGPVSPSACNGVIVDCVESPFGGLVYGQDECYGTTDAALDNPVSFAACSLATVSFRAADCGDTPVDVYLNLLVDWSLDGDWNDNILCSSITRCAPEWAVKNALITLAPGCQTLTTPSFQVGPRIGVTWMRLTLSTEPAPIDFPWNGSASLAGGTLHGGETEDYQVRIDPSVVSVSDGGQPRDLWLGSVAPNPSASSSGIRFGLAREGRVSLAVFDLAGRRLATLVDGTLRAGEHTVEWDGRDASGRDAPVGVYLVKLRAEGRVLTQRAIHIH